jgi:hypothetical protein
MDKREQVSREEFERLNKNTKELAMILHDVVRTSGTLAVMTQIKLDKILLTWNKRNDITQESSDGA